MVNTSLTPRRGSLRRVPSRVRRHELRADPDRQIDARAGNDQDHERQLRQSSTGVCSSWCRTCARAFMAISKPKAPKLKDAAEARFRRRSPICRLMVATLEALATPRFRARRARAILPGDRAIAALGDRAADRRDLYAASLRSLDRAVLGGRRRASCVPPVAELQRPRLRARRAALVDHHAADALARMHQVEALVDVGERHACG